MFVSAYIPSLDEQKKHNSTPQSPPEFHVASLISLSWRWCWKPLWLRVRMANAVLICIGPLEFVIRRPWLPKTAWSLGWDRGYWAGKEAARAEFQQS